MQSEIVSWWMQGGGEYSISDFIESTSPLTLSYQSAPDEGHIWTFWSKEDDDYPQTISSSSSSSCMLLPQTLQDVIKDFVLGNIKKCELVTFDNFLIQFWAPMIVGGRCVLKTSSLPFGLKRIERGLCEYRKHCMSLEFSTSLHQDEEEDEEFGGGGGESVIRRVFRNKQMEVTPNVKYYSTKDYPQLQFAVNCGIQNSLALPLFQPNYGECIGVLELVGYFPFNYLTWDVFIYARNALERSAIKALLPFEWQIRRDMKDEVPEYIHEALKVACTKHPLPFAQIWIVGQPSGAMDYVDSSENSCHSSSWWSNNRLTFTDDLFTFGPACRDHLLRVGQGVVGKALLSRKPCFCRDVTEFSITEYPLSHYARYCGLTGCFAIYLHTPASKNHDYVIEFFLPPEYTISEDPRPFLESIFTTVKNHLQGFEIDLGEELYVEVLNISINDEPDSAFRICQTFGIQPISESLQNETFVVDDDGRSKVFGAEHKDEALACLEKREEMLEEEIEYDVGEELCLKVAKTATNVEITTVRPPRAITKTLQNEMEVVQLLDKDSAMEAGRNNEMNVVYSERNGVAGTSAGKISGREETPEIKYRTDGSLSREDLEQHFGKKLDDAAAFLGVSRSTMKRACRANSIKKWPFPKRMNVKPSPSNLKQVNERVGNGPKKIPKFAYSEPSCSNPPPTHTIGVVAHTISNVTPKQDEGSVIVKATYGDEIIRFRLTSSSRKADLMEKVTLRLPVKEGTFNIKYEDDDDDWVLIACDEDLEECIGISKEKSTIKMLVQPITNKAP